ncbi:MAG: hypothetical protein ACOC7O_02890 [Thermoplasmatota archaeon]
MFKMFVWVFAGMSIAFGVEIIYLRYRCGIIVPKDFVVAIYVLGGLMIIQMVCSLIYQNLIKPIFDV